jgi:surface antigen
MKARKGLMAVVAVGLGLGSVGCASNAGTGALIGGAGGALAGAAIGSHSHSRAGAGALIGGAVGALGGAVIGSEIDRQERDRSYDGRYSRGYDRDRVYEDDYYYKGRVYRPAYRRVVVRYDDCGPRGYGHRSYRYGRGGRYYDCD